MPRRTIGLIGSSVLSDDALGVHVAEVSRVVGAEVARSGAVLVSGGSTGAMAIACESAQAAGGLTVGFLPQPDLLSANPHLDLAFPTGMGTMRNVLTARCADALVMVGGGVGTLNELTLAYDFGVPVVMVTGTGGWVDRIVPMLVDGRFLDERRAMAIDATPDPRQAVRLALRRAKNPRVDGSLRAHLGAAGN